MGRSEAGAISACLRDVSRHRSRAPVPARPGFVPLNPAPWRWAGIASASIKSTPLRRGRWAWSSARGTQLLRGRRRAEDSAGSLRRRSRSSRACSEKRRRCLADHPSIAHVYGLEVGGEQCIVMGLSRERRRGASYCRLPRDALRSPGSSRRPGPPYERGIVHRD